MNGTKGPNHIIEREALGTAGVLGHTHGLKAWQRHTRSLSYLNHNNNFNRSVANFKWQIDIDT